MAKNIAKALLDIEAVSLSPNDLFTWSSGIKSPIYCDNRITLGYPEVRNAIRDGLIQLIKEHFLTLKLSRVRPLLVSLMQLTFLKNELPMNYVRSKVKAMVNKTK